MKQFYVLRDKSSIATYFTEITDAGWTGSLAADTDLPLTVPTGARVAIIGASDHYFVSESAITIPAAGSGTFTETDAELDKDQIIVEGVATLHFRARNVTDISVSFYG